MCFSRNSLASTPADTTEDPLSLSQLLGVVSQHVSLPLDARWLGNHSLNIGAWDIPRHHGRKHVVQTTDDVSLDDLSCDIGDEGLLLDLWEAGQRAGESGVEGNNGSYLVYGKQAVQSFLTAEVLHVCSGRVAPIVDSSLDDFFGGKVLICINVDLLGRKILQLL